MTQTLIEKLESLSRFEVSDVQEFRKGYFIDADDLNAIIEQHKAECEPVASIIFNEAEEYTLLPTGREVFKLPPNVEHSLYTTPPGQSTRITELEEQRDRLLELLSECNQELKDGIENEGELEAEHSKHARVLCAKNDALIAEIEAIK